MTTTTNTNREVPDDLIDAPGVALPAEPTESAKTIPLPEVVVFSVYEQATGRVVRSGWMMDEASALAQGGAGESVYLGEVPPLYYVGADGLVAMGEPPTPDHAFDWVVHEWSDPRTIAQIQDRRWSEIKAHRDLLEASGFPYLGKTLDSDTRSVQRINTAVQAAQVALAVGQPFDIVWTCADNSTLELTGEQMFGAPVALALHADNLHQIAKALRVRIYAADTEATISAIEWPINYEELP